MGGWVGGWVGGWFVFYLEAKGMSLGRDVLEVVELVQEEVFDTLGLIR